MKKFNQKRSGHRVSEVSEFTLTEKIKHPPGKKTVSIIFQPEGRRAQVPPGTTVMDAARKVGINIVAPCGGIGECGKCKVEIFKGKIVPTQADQFWLTEKELQKGFRLACMARVDEDVVVRIPFATRLFSQKILTTGSGEPVDLDPCVHKSFIQMKPPDVGDQRGDFERILDALKLNRSDYSIDFELLHQLSNRLRKADYSGTAVFLGTTLLDFQPEDTTSKQFALALDVGTTTVVGTLINLKAGEQVEVASQMNPQMSFGDDLISRIDYANTHEMGVLELQRRVVRAINDIIAETAEKADISREDVYEIVMVGNTAMHHIFLKLPPKFLGQAPFAPTIQSALHVSAKELGLKIHPKGQVYTFPNIAGFVGGDAVGVALATGLAERKGNYLVVDIGTNGEILLGVNGRLLAASAAAGPAFEGARISQGMRGTTGAIERVQIKYGRLVLEVIENMPPIGICGSGLIDSVAELRRVGIIDQTGRMVESADENKDISDEILRRLVDHSHGKAFVLATKEEAGIDHPLMVTQKDVRELQLAKGAIAAAVNILLKEAGLATQDLDEILLAGAFGNYLDRVSARRIGLIPAVPIEKIHFVGNAASAGAQMAAVSREARRKAEKIAREARHIELSVRPDFQEEFMNAMFFPEIEDSK